MLRMSGNEEKQEKLRTKGKNIALQVDVLREFERFCFKQGLHQQHAASAALGMFMQANNDLRAVWLQRVADIDAGSEDIQDVVETGAKTIGDGPPESDSASKADNRLQQPPKQGGRGASRRRK